MRLKLKSSTNSNGSATAGTASATSCKILPFPGGKAEATVPTAVGISNKKTNNKSKNEKAAGRGRPRTHGLSNTPTYGSWRNAKQRCTNENFPQYKDYGGRGIECRITIEQLVDDIGLRPEGHTLDRIDPNGHYEVGNLRWATPQQQARNRRDPEPYRQRAIRRIRDYHQKWINTGLWWCLSIKAINQGGLPAGEFAELKRLSRETKLPNMSFAIDDCRWGSGTARIW